MDRSDKHRAGCGIAKDAADPGDETVGAMTSVVPFPTEAAIQEFIDAHHTDPKPFIWTNTADGILASIARFAQRTAPDRAAQVIS